MASFNQPNWVPVPSATSATCKIISSCNQNAFGLFSDGQIAIFNTNLGQWTWTLIPAPSQSSVVGLSSSPDNSAIAYTSDGFAYTYNGIWQMINATGVIEVAVGDSHNFVVIDDSGIVKHTPAGTSTISLAGPTKLSVTPGLSELWGVDNEGKVYRLENETWTEVPGPGRNIVDIHVSLSSTNQLQVVCVDNGGEGWIYDGSTWSYIVLPSSSFFSTLEGGANCMWAVTTNGELYCGFL